MGGTQPTHLKKLQRIMNHAARYVLDRGRRWKTLRLMEECGWMTVTELAEMHTLVTMWKIKNYGSPEIMSEKFSWNEDDEAITHSAILQTTDNFFRNRGEKG